MNKHHHARLEAWRAKLADRSVDQGNVWFAKGELAFGLGLPRADVRKKTTVAPIGKQITLFAL